LLTALQNN